MTRYLFLVFAATALFSAGAHAQTKKPVKKATTTNASRTTSTLPPLDVRAARVKVSNQLTNVSLFTKNLGPVAQAIEALDSEAKIKKVNTQSLDQNTKDKQRVVTAIRNLREGIVKLESEFRVKPALKKYLPTIQGISDLAGQAETSAVAGKFVAANTPLRTLQQKLSDTLMAMPNVEL
ncbi:MAG TPA: hypothetical protein VMZ26_11255 [Pyrinomonadaceae bacterium]|nr:hypothetical protein [Pyrinomonadaceae bacterium]